MVLSSSLVDRLQKGIADFPVPNATAAPTFQSHGVVCVVRMANRKIADVSSNAGAWFGRSAARWVGKPLHTMLGDAAATLLDDLASSGENLVPLQMNADVDGVTRRLAVRARRCGAWAIVEIEADDDAPPIDWLRYTAELNRSFLDQATTDVLARRAVQIAHRITGFERILLWRFGTHDDEVIAEHCNAGIATSQGLKFPPDDALRRGLTASYPGRVRYVADLSAPPVSMHDPGTWMADADAARGVSLAMLRCASHPGHASQFGTRAFVRAGIWIGDRLWGMIECLNTAPRRATREMRGALPLLVQMFARELAIAEGGGAGAASPALCEDRNHRFDAMRRSGASRSTASTAHEREAPPLSFWIIDTHETVTFARGEGVPVDGAGRDSPTGAGLANPFVGRTLSAIFAGDPSGAMLHDAYERGLAGQEHRYRVALHGRRYDAFTEPVRDADGGIVGVAAFSIDVTDQETADAALAASDARRDHLLRMSSDWECEVDRDGRFVYASEGFSERFGITPGRYLGMKIGSLDFVRYLPGDFERFVEAARAQRPFRNLRARLVGGSGEEIILSTNADPLFDDSGAFAGYLGMVRDVSAEARAETALATSYARIDRLLSLSSDFEWEINRAGRIVHVSAPSAGLFGAAPERLIGALFAESQAMRFMPGHFENFRRAQRARAPFRDLRMACVDPVGNDAILSVSAEPTFDATGEFSGYLGMMRDVTREHEAVVALAASEARYRSVVDALAEGITIHDADNRIVSINDAACEMLGVKREDVVGAESVAWPGVVDANGTPVSPEQYPSYLALRLGRESEKVVLGLGARGAPRRWISESTRLLRDPQSHAVTGIVTSTRDVTDQKTGQERLAYLADHDALTGLANQTRFCAEVDALLGRTGGPASCALLVFDLRQFGAVNASLGHAFGDRLLCACAARLNRFLVDGSQRAVAVARIVGDQFAVLIDSDGRDRSAAFADHLLLMSKRPFHIDETEIHLDASIGIALGPEDGGDSATLLKHAHLALSDAKARHGHGYEFFTSELATAPRERLALDSSLRRALKHGEFLLHYQPQVDARSGRITGMEALLRWHSPERGMVPPGAFIALMEDTGLIVPVGEWVMMTAVAQLQAWREAGFNDLTMSVNVSPRQFQDRNLVVSTEAVLELYGTPPGCVEIEITENVTAKDPEHALQLLRVFERLGMRLAIDDFGTGYSNLAALKRFPMQRLKIDQSFVREMLTDSDNAAIVRAIVAMATSLRLDLVAEGVETAEQLTFLRALGCHTYQGYLFARPLPAAAATQMLLENAARPA